MKFLLCMGLFVLSQTWLHAQQPLELKLWPEGMPNDNGMTCQEENGVLYVAEPTLTVYPATEENGMAIVACPGGGYGKLAMDHEGKDMAAWFNNQGITYAVLKYRMPNGHKEEEDDYSNELHADGNTPPAFILHSSDNRSVPVAHSLNYYMALLRYQVPATLHIYPIGGHGWGYRDSFTYKREWTGELGKWLREINK